MRKLDWLVVRDFAADRDGGVLAEAPEIERGEVRPEDIEPKSSSSPPPRIPKKTAASPTRSGCCSGITRPSSRRAIAAANCDFIFHLGMRLKKLYATIRRDPKDRPIQRSHLGLSDRGPHRGAGCRSRAAGDQRLHRRRSRSRSPASPISERRRLDRLRLLDLFRLLQGRRQSDGAPQAEGEQNWVAPEWGWAWPPNRRILYNRASADPEGKPWSERKSTSGGTRRREVDRLRRAGLHQRSAALVPPAERRAGHGHHRRHRSVHHACGRQGLDLSRRRACRTARCRRTTSRRNP